MRLVRFTARAFHEGRIIEPGEELLVPDDLWLGAHMIDVAAGVAPAFVPRVVSVFRPSLADSPSPVVASTGPLSPDDARAKATQDAIDRAEATRKREAPAAKV